MLTDTDDMMEISQLDRFIIAPREQCESCNGVSGPKFNLSKLRNITDFHRANLIPTGIERKVAEDNIAYAQSEIALLNDEISRLTQTIQKLQRRRNALHRFEKQERSLFSPIRKLPTEILRYIFLLAHPRPDFPVFIHDTKAFLRVATQVSSHWRHVAHACTHLWANVCAVLDDMPGVGPFLENCIKFSKSLPMKYRLSSGCEPYLLGENCVKALAQNAYRWQEITIGDGDLVHELFAQMPINIPIEHLEKLDLLHISDSTRLSLTAAPKLTQLLMCGSKSPNAQRITLHYVPSLTSLTLGKMKNPSRMVTGVPWSQITQFSGINNDYMPDELISLLEGMPNLVSLSLRGATGTERAIVLPYLETLEISGSAETNALDILTTPQLKKLILGRNFSGISEFAQCSSFSLEVLNLTNMSLDSDTWLSPEFSNIKELHWEDPLNFGEGIERLTMDLDLSPDDIFPHLERLHISTLNYTPGEDDRWTIDNLFDMIKSRMLGHLTDMNEADFPTKRHHIKRFQLFLGKHLALEDIPKIHDFTSVVLSEPLRNSKIDATIYSYEHSISFVPYKD